MSRIQLHTEVKLSSMRNKKSHTGVPTHPEAHIIYKEVCWPIAVFQALAGRDVAYLGFNSRLAGAKVWDVVLVSYLLADTS